MVSVQVEMTTRLRENLTHHIHKTYLNKKNYYFVSAHPALADVGSHTVSVLVFFSFTR